MTIKSCCSRNTAENYLFTVSIFVEKIIKNVLWPLSIFFGPEIICIYISLKEQNTNLLFYQVLNFKK